MTRKERNEGCKRLKQLHAYCKRKWLKDEGRWVCVVCLVDKKVK